MFRLDDNFIWIWFFTIKWFLSTSKPISWSSKEHVAISNTMQPNDQTSLRSSYGRSNTSGAIQLTLPTLIEFYVRVQPFTPVFWFEPLKILPLNLLIKITKKYYFAKKGKRVGTVVNGEIGTGFGRRETENDKCAK